MSKRWRRRSAIAAPGFALVLLAEPGIAQSVSDVVGIWNLEMRQVAERATGGVRNVLLRVQEVDGRLQAEITSPRNNFLDVDSFQYADGTVSVEFGAYEYSLNLEAGGLTGTVFSPVDTLRVVGTRQQGTMYAGDEPEEFHTTRVAILGHRTGIAPSDDEPDPAGWMKNRIESTEDLALIVEGGVYRNMRGGGTPVSFTNAAEYEEALLAYAGRRVSVTGVWVGERLRIDAIELAEDRAR